MELEAIMATIVYFALVIVQLIRLNICEPGVSNLSGVSRVSFYFLPSFQEPCERYNSDSSNMGF